jgi:hypothetical protein
MKFLQAIKKIKVRKEIVAAAMALEAFIPSVQQLLMTQRIRKMRHSRS